ncbi:MAG: hypothetical protein IJ886_09370 [Prevotella sp.]|nr:hypothetical protein [Prevotella sp.]MBR2230459.1 hypothetical protein [Prevotella sp.]
MNKHISALLALIMGALMMTSCLKSDDTSEIIYNNDTAITAFSLTTVNRYIHTTSSSGADSVYKKALSTPVSFNIDQYNQTVYNSDSLLNDCDLKHVLISVSTKNSGVAVIKSLTSDTLTTILSTDSLDFTQPREVRVYAQDGKSYRAYKVTMNKHQVATDKILWEKMPVDSYPYDAEEEKWDQIVDNAGLAQFIGAGTKEAYAYDMDGRLMVSKDEGATWNPDTLDASTTLLPRENIAFVSYPFEANEDTDYQLIAGVVDEDDIVSVVWRKVAEYAEGSQPGKWCFVPVEVFNRYYLPSSSDLSLVWFHKKVLAISNSWILVSIDGGITWKEYDKLQLPDDENLMSVKACTDGEGAIWLKDLITDNVWRGILVEE